MEPNISQKLTRSPLPNAGTAQVEANAEIGVSNSFG
jgi:hypothetical protein